MYFFFKVTALDSHFGVNIFASCKEVVASSIYSQTRTKHNLGLLRKVLRVNICFSISLKIYIMSLPVPAPQCLTSLGKLKKITFSCSVKKLFLRGAEGNAFFSAKYGSFECVQRNGQINPERSFMKGTDFCNVLTTAYWLSICLKGRLRDNRLH